MTTTDILAMIPAAHPPSAIVAGALAKFGGATVTPVQMALHLGYKQEVIDMIDMFWEPTFNAGLIYLSDEIILTQFIPGEVDKNSLSRFYKTLREDHKDYAGNEWVEIDRNHPLVQSYLNSLPQNLRKQKQRSFNQNKLFFAATGKFFKMLLTQARTPAGIVACEYFMLIEDLARYQHEYIRVMNEHIMRKYMADMQAQMIMQITMTNETKREIEEKERQCADAKRAAEEAEKQRLEAEHAAEEADKQRLDAEQRAEAECKAKDEALKQIAESEQRRIAQEKKAAEDKLAELKRQADEKEEENKGFLYNKDSYTYIAISEDQAPRCTFKWGCVETDTHEALAQRLGKYKTGHDAPAAHYYAKLAKTYNAPLFDYIAKRLLKHRKGPHEKTTELVRGPFYKLNGLMDRLLALYEQMHEVALEDIRTMHLDILNRRVETIPRISIEAALSRSSPEDPAAAILRNFDGDITTMPEAELTTLCRTIFESFINSRGIAYNLASDYAMPLDAPIEVKWAELAEHAKIAIPAKRTTELFTKLESRWKRAFVAALRIATNLNLIGFKTRPRK